MFSFWCCLLTLGVLVFLFPNTTLGHLGSALKTGSGTLTKFAFGDNIIYCTFTNLGEGRPPILSHVRVSREPQTHRRILFKNDGSEGAPDPLLQTSRIKSPSYQHKILQFHSNGQTSSSGPYDYMPLKLITNQYPSTKSQPVYPVASKFGKVDTSRLIGSTSTGSWPDDDEDDDDNDSWERYSTSSRWEPNLLEKSDEPKYTPFIGARALTNIPQFFQHIRDNIHAIHEKQRELASNKKEIEGASSSSAADASGEEDVDKYSETQDIQIATPTRRGSQIINGKANDDVDGRTKELLHFLGHARQEYPKANNYNPACLFTNLGLGKRSSKSNSGVGDSFYNQ